MTDAFRSLLIACAFCAGVVPATAEPKITPGEPIDVGLSTSSSTRNVTSLNNGGALFAVSDGLDVFVRPVDAKGKAKPAVSLTTDGRSEFGISEAKLTKLSNGNVAAAWIGRPNGQSAVLIRVVKPDGTAASSEIVISAASAGTFQSEVSATALPGGRFVVAWNDFQPPDKKALMLRVFAANGEAQGLPATLAPPADVTFADPRVAALGDAFVLTYSRFGAGKGVFAQRFTASAKTSGGPVRLDEANKLVHEDPRTRKLDSGGVAVIWRENTYSEAGSLPIVVDTKLKGVFLDKKGKRGKAIAIDDPIVAKSKESAVTMSETDAGLLVAWSVGVATETDDLNSDIRGAFVSFSGKTGKIFDLAKNKDREGGPHFARLKNGRSVLGYSARAADEANGPIGALGAFPKISD